MNRYSRRPNYPRKERFKSWYSGRQAIRWICVAAIGAAILVINPGLFAATREIENPQVIGYVFPQEGLLKPGDVAGQKLTRINYAFANIHDGKIVNGFSNDAANFATLNGLKAQNPSLKILISVGGWLWSGGFSDAVLTEQSRKIFIDSVISFIEKYNLDGLDIDWEYPGMPGAGHTFRPEDKQNYTAVLRELRERFNTEEKKLHRRLYLSVATGGEANFLAHTEMGKVAKYVDTVNLMSYDYHEPDGPSVAGFNAPLYTNPQDPKPVSTDKSVRLYEAAGVPAGKLVLGVPFYGHEWGDVADVNHGLFQLGKPVPGAFAKYGNIVNTMINPQTPDNGYVRYWDPVSKVPYLYNQEKKLFVSYDDPESMALKAQYTVDHKLGGIMFWDYSGDPSGVLLDTIDAVLFHQPQGAGTQ
jgi:chitinase